MEKDRGTKPRLQIVKELIRLDFMSQNINTDRDTKSTLPVANRTVFSGTKLGP
jgi:hypothetical protein